MSQHRGALGTLYFLQVLPDGPVKIGWTSGSVANRARSLQQASPYILKWIGAAPGGIEAEASAHRELAAHCLRGEWFHPAPEVFALIERACPDWSEADYTRTVYRVDLIPRLIAVTRYRDPNNFIISEYAGIDSYWLYKWRENFKRLSPKTLALLEEAIDLAERGLLPGIVGRKPRKPRARRTAAQMSAAA